VIGNVSQYTATIKWHRGDDVFSNNCYSRAHAWEFDGGATVAASASPNIVPLPMSVAENIDPEEAFVASISSCHMLFFLAIAAQRGFVVDDYLDEAAGIMEKRSDGKTAITKVRLRPRASYSGSKVPRLEDVQKMHHKAHQMCFIANSVHAEIETDIVA
jgi:organic hydroperoxide reductase OsmC/OhrA